MKGGLPKGNRICVLDQSRAPALRLAGTRWRHVPQAQHEQEVSNGAGETAVGDENELPWQVVGVMDEAMLQNLKLHFRRRREPPALPAQARELAARASGLLQSSRARDLLADCARQDDPVWVDGPANELAEP